MTKQKQLAEDMAFIRKRLPEHYRVTPSQNLPSVHCISKIGMKKGKNEIDDDDRFSAFMRELRKHFGNRFVEVNHNTCTWHLDFTVHLKD